MQLFAVVLARAAAGFCFLLAALCAGGVLLSAAGWAINLVMAAVFALFGALFLWHGKTLKNLAGGGGGGEEHFARFFRSECVLLFFANLFLFVLLSGAASRVFGEGLPIFG